VRHRCGVAWLLLAPAGLATAGWRGRTARSASTRALISPSGSHVARASYRDFDGVTRPVARTGRTPAIARNKLLTALRERSTPSSRSGLTTESRFSGAAELWLAASRKQRERWPAALEADRRAVARDLPDLTRWTLATGLRIGEALAVAWSDVDLDAGTVEVDWKLIRITGEGLRRVRRLKGGDDRTCRYRRSRLPC
jgi:integrase